MFTVRYTESLEEMAQIQRKIGPKSWNFFVMVCFGPSVLVLIVPPLLWPGGQGGDTMFACGVQRDWVFWISHVLGSVF